MGRDLLAVQKGGGFNTQRTHPPKPALRPSARTGSADHRRNAGKQPIPRVAERPHQPASPSPKAERSHSPLLRARLGSQAPDGCGGSAASGQARQKSGNRSSWSRSGLPPSARRSGRKEIGRAHVSTPVTNAQLVCRLLLEKKNNKR